MFLPSIPSFLEGWVCYIHGLGSQQYERNRRFRCLRNCHDCQSLRHDESTALGLAIRPDCRSECSFSLGMDRDLLGILAESNFLQNRLTRLRHGILLGSNVPYAHHLFPSTFHSKDDTKVLLPIRFRYHSRTSPITRL